MHYSKGEFIESSRDYAENSVLILFEGTVPSLVDVTLYLERTYNIKLFEIVSTTEPSDYNGLQNPGSVSVKILMI